MSTQREPPIIKKPVKPADLPEHAAAIIFLHGLGDDAQGVEDIGTQFQSASKLPYATWVFPNALENRDAMQTAWYTPTSLTAPPAGRPELADDEDEDGLLSSVSYVESLIDSLVAKGVPSERIVIGGFSQGCAVTLLTELVSKKYAGRLAGVIGIMGYLPVPDRIQHLRTEAELPHVVGETPVFLGRGLADRLVPRSKWEETKMELEGLGVRNTELHEYEGLGHTVSPSLLKDLSIWLEKVLPPLD